MQIARGRLLGAALCAFSAACAGGAVSACSPKAAEPAPLSGECSLNLGSEAPKLEAPIAWKPPESRLVAELELSTALLGRELEKQVPRRLADVKGQSVGAAGELTYRVERSGFAVGLQGERLVVSTPVQADVEVCKRLGPLCVTYGSCQPRLRADVSLPLIVDPQYRLGPSSAKVNVERGCVLQPIGIDQTSRVHEAAHKQEARVKARIDGSLPNIRSDVAQVWRLLHMPVAIDNTLCLRIEPTGVSQQKPKLKSDGKGQQLLSTRLAVRGKVRVEDPCVEPHEASPEKPLPAPDLEDDLPANADLEVPLFIDWSSVSAQLTRVLSTQPIKSDAGTVSVAKVETRPASLDGKSRLALGLTLSGVACGESWFLAEPVEEPQRKVLVLSEVRALAPGALPPELERALSAALTQRGVIDLPVDLSAAPGTLEGLVKRLTTDLPRQVQLDLEVEEARVANVVAQEQGLVPVVSVAGHAKLWAR
ncbi:MAG: DUF4403 family protein [Myxococcales bacterium]|nr:DUF4403 family protein [Myxococcales bacterium]